MPVYPYSPTWTLLKYNHTLSRDPCLVEYTELILAFDSKTFGRSNITSRVSYQKDVRFKYRKSELIMRVGIMDLSQGYSSLRSTKWLANEGVKWI